MNASKNKGDKGEREAVEVLKLLAPDLVVRNAMRKLGAGRKEDTGDLVVFDDVTIQVKCLAKLGEGLYAAASGATIQGERAGTTWSVGMAPIPRARREGIRWLCVANEWPTVPGVHLPSFASTTKAVEYLVSKSQVIGILNVDRVAVVERKGQPTLFLAPVSAWVDAYRLAHNKRFAA